MCLVVFLCVVVFSFPTNAHFVRELRSQHARQGVRVGCEVDGDERIHPFLYASVESFAYGNRLALYREQFLHLVSSVNVALLELPDRLSCLPNSTQEPLGTTVMGLEKTLHLNNTSFIENQQFVVDRLKEAFGSSSTLLTEMGLVIHYTTMWLFVHLQIRNT